MSSSLITLVTVVLIVAASALSESIQLSDDVNRCEQCEPAYRPRRSPQQKDGAASVSVNQENGVTSLRGGLQGTLFKNDDLGVKGSAYYQRNFGPAPKYQAGAGLNVKHDNGAYGAVNYDKTPNFGSLRSSVGYERGPLRLEAYHNRNFGHFGPRNDYGGMLTYSRRF